MVLAEARRHIFSANRSWTLIAVDTLETGYSGEEVDAGLRAPMPGRIVALTALPGAVLEKGTPLLLIEAMKMEHAIRAPAKGIVKAFRFTEGDLVAEGEDLVDFEKTV